MTRRLIAACAFAALSFSLLFGAMSGGIKTVTFGSPEALVASATPATWIIISADCGNGANVFIDFNATPAVSGLELEPCKSWAFSAVTDLGTAFFDVGAIYADAASGSQDVRFSYRELE